MKTQLDFRLSSRWAQRITKQKMTSFARTVAPTFLALTLATAAHAQGTIDFSGAYGVMTSFKTFALFAGPIICFGGLIFAGIRMMSGRFEFTASDREQSIRKGDFATVERIADNNAMAVRLDNGKAAGLCCINSLRRSVTISACNQAATWKSRFTKRISL